jgi:hypothetical protein
MKARLAAFSVIALLIGVAAGEADRIFGRGGNETLSSGVRADFLTGGVGRDGLNGGAGQDRVAAQYDDSIDPISCGSGADVVTADRDDPVAADCGLVSRRLSNRRGVCTSPGRECSGGSDDYAASSQAVVGAVEFLRARGGKEIVLIGASVGAAWRGLVVTGLSGLLSAWCR